MYIVDDKAKIPLGEPGNPVSTLKRNKKSIATGNQVFSALDHDTSSKCSLTPSVVLKVDIPTSSDMSWYRGQVSVTLHDSVFESSNPYRYAAMIINDYQKCENTEPFLFKFSDGGSEHRTTYLKVQLASIAIFKTLDLDLMAAARCAPGQSWISPVERVNALLNIRLYNTSTSRRLSSDEMEALFKKANSMAQLRELPIKYPKVHGIEEAWEESVVPVKTLLSTKMATLSLKGKPFNILNPIPTSNIDTVTKLLKKMFPNIDPCTATMSLNGNDPTLVAYMKNHARRRQYTFQLRKCDDDKCCPAPTDRRFPTSPLWLPDPVLDDTKEHYKPCADVMGEETTDAHRPSMQKTAKKKLAKIEDQPNINHFMIDDIKEQMSNKSLFTAQNGKFLVECGECSKPRVIYSKNRLTDRQSLLVATSISESDFTCGSPLLETTTTITTRLNITCGSPVELAYYSAKLGPEDICAHCAAPHAETNQALKKKFKTVLPCCEACLHIGKQPIVNMEIVSKKSCK
jgi:hypothetical protein